jgi:TonB family protein
MRSSLILSLCFHGCVIAALVVLFHTVPRMHLPEKIYSVKILQPVMGSRGAASSATDEAKKTDVKVETPKPKQPKKEAPKVAVPKKPEKKKEEAKPKNEGEAAPEKPLGVSVGAGAESGTGIAVDAARFPFSYFLSAIERKVSENWYTAVSESGAGLSCVVYFRLMRNGGVQDVKIETSSGNSYFDRAALRAVKSAAPFPPLPGGFPDDFLGIHFTFVQKE